MSIKMFSIVLYDHRFMNKLFENAVNLHKQDVIVDYRQFNNGIQIISNQDNLENIKNQMSNGINCQLIFKN